MEGEDSWREDLISDDSELALQNTHYTFESTRVPFRFFNPHRALWRRVDYSHVSCCSLRHQTWVGVEGQILLGRISGKLHHVCVRWSMAGGVREGCARTLADIFLGPFARHLCEQRRGHLSDCGSVARAGNWELWVSGCQKEDV